MLIAFLKSKEKEKMSCIWRVMYRDVLQPGDTFPMMMRKMVMAVGAILGIFPVTIVIQFLMGLIEINSSSYPRFISWAVVLIGPWIYVKRTHTAPTWLIAIWTNSNSVLTLLGMLNSPNAAYEFSLIGTIIIVLLCKVHSANLTVPVMSLFVFAYNFSLGRMGAPYPLIVLPDGSDSPPGTLVYSYVHPSCTTFTGPFRPENPKVGSKAVTLASYSSLKRVTLRVRTHMY